MKLLLFTGLFALLGTVLFAQSPYVFLEENGLVVMEFESTTTYGSWMIDTTISGYVGDHYLHYTGPNYYNNPGNSLLTYQVEISTVGTYRFQWHSRIAQGTSNTDHNDSWLRIPDAAGFYAQKGASMLYPHGSGMSPNPEGSGSNGWFKIYQNALGNWTWNTFTNDNNPYSIYVDFDSVGVYTIEVAGRSKGHAIDRMVLYHSSVNTATATNLGRPESPKDLVSSIAADWQDLAVYPNPAQDQVEIVFPPSLQLRTTSISLLDLSGKLVKEVSVSQQNDQRLHIPIDELPAGMYLLLLNAETTPYRGKFMKQ
ncbi:MAG: T9SS type A sorting domain-containing protein [Bacteroidota bacterium]